jgi:NAD+ synthase
MKEKRRIKMAKLIYGSAEYEALKAEALALCGVTPTEKFDVKGAIRFRIDYLKNFLKTTGLKGFVLGISGGVDSSAAGKLAQLACEELRQEGVEAKFVAMRLPAGVQFDEADAQKAMTFIKPDVSLTVNIGESANILNRDCLIAVEGVGAELSAFEKDFHKGNLKARLRMTAQYHAAATYGLAVLGTDHSTELITGFFSKWADGACDLTLLSGLNKTQVRLVAKELGAPESLYAKAATADLEEAREGLLDEDALSISYKDIDTFLEGKSIAPEVEYKLIHQYMITQHKRKPIVSPV